MNTISFICLLVLSLLLPISLLGSSGTVFFTEEELTEMGVRLEPSDMEGIASIA